MQKIGIMLQFISVQFSRSVLSDCGPMNRSTPVLPVHHQLQESTQTHAHRVRDASIMLREKFITLTKL